MLHTLGGQQKQRGLVLLSVLLMMSLVAIILASSSRLLLDEQRLTAVAYESLQALWWAEWILAESERALVRDGAKENTLSRTWRIRFSDARRNARGCSLIEQLAHHVVLTSRPGQLYRISSAVRGPRFNSVVLLQSHFLVTHAHEIGLVLAEGNVTGRRLAWFQQSTELGITVTGLPCLK